MADTPPFCGCTNIALGFGGKSLPELCEIQHAILESSVPAVIATDVEGTVVYFNPSTQRLLGYSWEEVVGRHVASIFHLDAEIEARARALTLELQRPVTAGFDVFIARLGQVSHEVQEWTYVCKDGMHIPVCLWVTALHDSERRLIGYVGVASDQRGRQHLNEDLQIAALAFQSQAAIMVTESPRNE